MKKIIFAALLLVTTISVCSAQVIAKLEVNLSEATSGIDVPVSVTLDDITLLPDSSPTLFEVTGNKTQEVAYQISENDHRSLYLLINTKNNKSAAGFCCLIQL